MRFVLMATTWPWTNVSNAWYLPHLPSNFEWYEFTQFSFQFFPSPSFCGKMVSVAQVFLRTNGSTDPRFVLQSFQVECWRGRFVHWPRGLHRGLSSTTWLPSCSSAGATVQESIFFSAQSKAFHDVWQLCSFNLHCWRIKGFSLVFWSFFCL